MNVILFEATELTAEGTVRVTGPRAAHLTKVLAVTPGQDVRVGIVDGATGRGVVTEVGADAVALKCSFGATPPGVPRIDLLLAVPRPKVLRRLWAQLAALGVGRIILTNAERVERHYFDTHILQEHAYRPLLIEGLQQARDTLVPAVSVHRRFKVLIEDELDKLAGDAVRLVAHPGSEMAPGAPIAGKSATARVLLAVGPEGGWNDFELNLLTSRGFVAVGLGGRPLRTDTATIALLALLHQALARV